MKKYVITIFILVAGAFAASAQISVGLKAGLNISSQSFKNSGFDIDQSSIAGFHGGVYLNAKFGKFGVQPEAYYSMQGSKITISGVGSGQFDFTYINVPILLRWNVTDFFNIHLGPQFGILTGAKFSSGGVSQDFKDQVNSMDFSVAGGVGLDLPLGLSGGVRYVAGMTNFEKDNSTNETGKNNIFQIYVGYKLFGGK